MSFLDSIDVCSYSDEITNETQSNDRINELLLDGNKFFALFRLDRQAP